MPEPGKKTPYSKFNNLRRENWKGNGGEGEFGSEQLNDGQDSGWGERGRGRTDDKSFESEWV